MFQASPTSAVLKNDQLNQRTNKTKQNTLKQERHPFEEQLTLVPPFSVYGTFLFLIIKHFFPVNSRVHFRFQQMKG